jgi:hypothetical protein
VKGQDRDPGAPVEDGGEKDVIVAHVALPEDDMGDPGDGIDDRDHGADGEHSAREDDAKGDGRVLSILLDSREQGFFQSWSVRKSIARLDVGDVPFPYTINHVDFFFFRWFSSPRRKNKIIFDYFVLYLILLISF